MFTVYCHCSFSVSLWRHCEHQKSLQGHFMTQWLFSDHTAIARCMVAAAVASAMASSFSENVRLALLLESLADELLGDVSDVAAESSESEMKSPDSSVTPPPSQHVKTTSWWAPLVKAHLANHIPTQPESLRERTIVSACSGVFPEAEVLKAMVNGDAKNVKLLKHSSFPRF